MHARHLTAAVLTAVIVPSAAGSAAAAMSGRPTSSSQTIAAPRLQPADVICPTGVPTCTITVALPASAPGAGPAPAPAPLPTGAPAPLPPTGPAQPMPRPSGPARQPSGCVLNGPQLTCTGTAASSAPPAPPPPPLPAAGATAARNIGDLRFTPPVPVFNPLLGCRAVSTVSCADEYVGLPVWMADSNTAAVVNTTSVSNGVDSASITATARLVKTVWVMGDPDDGAGTVTCLGAGTLYDPARHSPDSSSPDCGYTYRHSSAHQAGLAFTGSVTAYYAITWVGSGAYAGQSGTQDKTVPGPVFGVPVGEFQAVNVRDVG